MDHTLMMSGNRSAEIGCESEINISSTNCLQTELAVTASAVSMVTGVLSNILALIILVKAYRRFRLKSKGSFLLFASSLVLTDLLGHLLIGALVLYVYGSHKRWEAFDPRHILCSLFGACMVFFGLSPLLLGSGMAVERYLGVTRPLFHSTAVTAHQMKRLLGLTWLLAGLVALLPVLLWRPYRVQRSQSWCFFRTERPRDWLDTLLPLLFSVLGLLALLVSIVCNALTSCTLLRSWRRQGRRRKRTSHHSEMICQLLAIMCVSCVCWGPLLVNVMMLSTGAGNDQASSRLLPLVRMATWNQILDPWVYILLRKAVLRKLFLLLQRCQGRRASPALPSPLKGSVETSISLIIRPDCSRMDSTALPDTRVKPTTRA